MDPPANLRLQVVLDRPVAVYSGMVPAFVAGEYALHELEIDVLPLARRAKASVILSAAVDLDPVRKEITLEGRPPIRFDLASLDVGSTVRGLDLPGVSKHTLATRPIGRFVRMIDERLDAFEQLEHSPRILIVGGGRRRQRARLHGRFALETRRDPSLDRHPHQRRRATRRIQSTYPSRNRTGSGRPRIRDNHFSSGRSG
jgi:selenide,water dikinase